MQASIEKSYYTWSVDDNNGQRVAHGGDSCYATAQAECLRALRDRADGPCWSAGVADSEHLAEWVTEARGERFVIKRERV